MNKNLRKGSVFQAFMVVALLLTSFMVTDLERLDAAPRSGVQAEASAMIDVNRATADELQVIRGIGPSLAERIIAYREENGAFENLDDLSNVRGIGGAKLQKIKEQVTV